MKSKLEFIENIKSTTASVKHWSKCWKDFIKIHYIELLILVFNLAQGLRASANFPSFYSKVCHDIYSWKPEICDNLNLNKTAENIVQHQTARWLLYKESTTFLPNLVMAMFFGSFGDKYGRKVPTLIAITSMVLHHFLYMVFVSMPIFPVYILVIEAGLVSMGGTKTVFVSAQYAEAANQSKDKTKLTQRFAVLTACISCAIFVAGHISKFLMKYISLVWILAFGQIVMTVAFILALALQSDSDETAKNNDIPNHGKPFKGLASVKLTTPRKADTVNVPGRHHRMRWLFVMLELYKSAWKSLTKSRLNHGRVHLFLYCFVGLIYSCADSGMDVVTSLYVYHAPLSWAPSIFSEWMATVSIVQMIGGLAGAYLLKRFGFSDYTVLLVGLTSAILKMTCISVATRTWMMYLALGLGCVSTAGISSLRSLITQLGPPEETGELTSILSIVVGWAKLTGSVLCNNIYASTLNYYTGATFVVIDLLLIVCFIVVSSLAYHSYQIAKKLDVPRHGSALFYVESAAC